ncbi:MAG TPA: hypothetical protein VHE61_23820 [Opitutaceae bacterium]|nr:hypothetical protein [Opitutaceae bacterium]
MSNGSSDKQLAANFAAVFKEIVPNATSRSPLAELLSRYKKEILKLRDRGLTWQQIADGMADPRIGVKVRPRALQRHFGSHRPVPPQPPPMPLVLDPVTGLPKTLKPAGG